MQDIRLEDIVTILGGTIVTAIVIALTAWMWERRVYLANRYLSYESLLRFGVPIMESMWAPVVDENNNQIAEETPATTTQQNPQNALQSVTTNSNELLQGQARALAVFVKGGKVGETEGIKMVFGVSPSSSNPRYLAARAALKAELERLNNPYPQRTADQEARRQELGLSKSHS
jgi:hypothetical protein